MQIVILPTADDVAAYGAELYIKQLTNKPDSVLGLATGSTPLALYRLLIQACQQQRLSFARAKTFNLDEYLGLAGDHPQSYRFFMQQHLFDAIDILPANTAVPDGNATDPFKACQQYEQQITDAGGIDLQLLGLGRNGHIGFNEPSSGLRSRTRVKTLTPATIADNARFFQPGEYQPHLSITMGIGTILDARKVLLLATGANKADAVQAMIEGPLTAACPASALQFHQQAIVVLDEDAAAKLADIEFYRHIERENQALLNRLSGH
ncbi:glucosamine-6-phosphate deaminase [Arsukibacterium indicum]|uniref:Glucosamine-6-phosphate deaminase n=1 Tax=Arsukibacterium indicum TaxID=2848612 RepID=A0ABS6MMT2_9GAMM|nr:glucosamine-6-phosphate deaminase [Arsukibacterium indicum]MBV2130123.1 glucosamine-6-phosphate deaminase [Arsukibacterium indicum]